MKILTKEEEAAHYSAVLKGGTVGTIAGLAGGLAAVMAASRRYHTFRSLTLPLKAFLITSTGTFCGIVAADHASRNFEAQRNLTTQYLENREERIHREELAQMSFSDRTKAFLHEERYKIVGVTWVASVIGSFILVGRNPYLTAQQKIVQARVYAQGLTLAVICASAAFEIHDQRKGRGLLEATRKGRQAQKEVAEPAHRERYEGEDLWKDMVAAEEEKLKKRQQPLYTHHPEHPTPSGKHENEKPERRH
ncbi:hypothetical protein V8E54_000310 [Elaphomyces granulatus]